VVVVDVIVVVVVGVVVVVMVGVVLCSVVVVVEPGVTGGFVGVDTVVLVDSDVVSIGIISVTVLAEDIIETFSNTDSVLFEELCSPFVLLTNDSSSALLLIGKIFSLLLSMTS
jgi:hypothetical protein